MKNQSSTASRSIGVMLAAMFGLAALALVPAGPAGSSALSTGCISAVSSTGICPPGAPAIVGASSLAGLYTLGVTSNGTVYENGSELPGANGLPLRAPIVGTSVLSHDVFSGIDGYWLVASDGGVFSFGTAKFLGSMGGSPLNAPIVGMAADGDFGYWLVAADGGVFAFGTAGFFGSRGGQPLNAPIVGMVATRDNGGYWLVSSDGGVFSFGDAVFAGSLGGIALNAPIVSVAVSATGHGGYFLFARDGGVFAFGDATFSGSFVGQISQPVVSAWNSGTDRYQVATSAGQIYPIT